MRARYKFYKMMKGLTMMFVSHTLHPSRMNEKEKFVGYFLNSGIPTKSREQQFEMAQTYKMENTLQFPTPI